MKSQASRALAVLAVTQISTKTAMWLVGGFLLVAAGGLWLMNPPTRNAAEAFGEEPAIPRRAWLRPRLVAVLLAAVAATIVLAGTDVGIVAALRSGGELEWTGLVLTLWGAYSLVGGFVYGRHGTLRTHSR